MYLKQIITAGATIFAVGTLTVATPAVAEPLEGGGVDRPPCSTLQRFIIDATGNHPVRKAHAIIGLTGPDADVEFARIQRAVSESCS